MEVCWECMLEEKPVASGPIDPRMVPLPPVPAAAVPPGLEPCWECMVEEEHVDWRPVDPRMVPSPLRSAVDIYGWPEGVEEVVLFPPRPHEEPTEPTSPSPSTMGDSDSEESQEECMSGQPGSHHFTTMEECSDDEEPGVWKKPFVPYMVPSPSVPFPSVVAWEIVA